MTNLPSAAPSSERGRIDPILLDVFWTRLNAMLNEQATALQRTAFSPVVRESGDCSVGIFDEVGGRMLAQAVTGTPGHIFALPACIRNMMAEYPLAVLRPGDVLITNDPYLNCGHQYDITVATPVFRDGRAVAVYASTAHVLDIGGRPLSAEAKDVYEEGLLIPTMKLYREGVANADLFSILKANVRTPDEVLGDISALVGTNEVGGRRLLEYMDELGIETIDGMADEILARSERAMRAAIQEIPDGEYYHETFCDGFDEPIKIAVHLKIKGDELFVDYAGSSPRSPKGINVVFNYTHAYTTYALKCAIAPAIPNNGGSLKPITVSAPLGSLLNAERPSPVASRHVMGHFLPGAIYGALGQALPQKVLAEGAAAVWYTTVAGNTTEGRRYLTSIINAGGYGARPTKDGLHAVGFPSGTTAVPVEVTEAVAPVVIRRRELTTDSGGPGTFRGGCGQTIEIEVRGEGPVFFGSSTDRIRHPAQGMAGGGAGAPGALELRGTPLRLKETNILKPGDVVTMKLPGAGGFFDPFARDETLVLADVVDGIVSAAAAKRDYGVVIDSSGAGVDAVATKKLRGARAARA